MNTNHTPEVDGEKEHKKKFVLIFFIDESVSAIATTAKYHKDAPSLVCISCSNIRP